MLYITGITGHSGRWFLKRLDREGYNGKIRCVMRQSREAAPDKYQVFDKCNLDLEFVVGDLEDKNFLAKTLKGVETLIHTAGIGFSPKIVTAAISNDVNWAILVHTTGRYSKFKSSSEEYIKIEDGILKQCEADEQGNRALNCTVLRPTMIYGSSLDRNMYRLVGYLDKHRFFPLFGDGSNLMQPVHARDLGNAYYQVMTHPEITMNRTYNLSGKEPITYLDIIKTICRQLNKRTVIIKLPIALSVFAAKVYNACFKNAVISVEQVMRMQEDKAFDYKDARADFGYSPMSFEDGVREEVAEYLHGVRVDFSNVRYQ